MTITRLRGVEAAASARGAVVVIDVLRAFTTAAYALESGAGEIVLVSTPEQAFALRERWPRALLVGEVGGRPIPGFDHGNSPAAMQGLDLRGKTIVLRSSSGTQGVTRAHAAKRLFLGSLVVAAATARALARMPGEATLLAMGSIKGPDGPEDDACADYLAALLERRPIDRRDVARTVEESPAGRQALDPAIDWISPEDLACAVAIDRFDFTMPVHREGELLVARADRSPD